MRKQLTLVLAAGVRRNVTARTLAITLALTVGLAACSGGSSTQPSIASLASTAPSAPASSDSSSIADSQQALLDWAQCMREQGFDVKDPQFGSDGLPIFGSLFAGVDTGSAEFTAAQDTCSHFRQGVSFITDPAQKTEMAARQLAFAQCMRAHGIDIPDPDPNATGPGSRGLFGGTNVDVNSPAYQAAYQACQSTLTTPSATAAP